MKSEKFIYQYNGPKIRQLRLALNASQHELARAVGISNYQICRIETEARAVNPSRAESIAYHLKCKLKDILKKVPAPSKPSKQVIQETPRICGWKVKAMRIKAGLTQKALAQILNTQQPSIASLEAKPHPVKSSRASLIAKALRCQIEDLEPLQKIKI